jgi:hypothetical protein
MNPRDAGRMLHLAYTFASNNTLIGFYIDELGEIWHNQYIPLGQDNRGWYNGIQKLWHTAQTLAGCAKAEWRFAIIRLGRCLPEEIQCKFDLGVV